MKQKFKVLLLILLLILSLAACNNQNNISKKDIRLTEMTVQFKYFDIIDGSEKNYFKKFESTSLKEVINDWINVMKKKGVDHGISDDGTSILNNLEVNYINIVDDNITVDFNSAFLDFDKSESEPGYFLIGFDAILKQTTVAKTYSINNRRFLRNGNYTS